MTLTNPERDWERDLLYWNRDFSILVEFAFDHKAPNLRDPFYNEVFYFEWEDKCGTQLFFPKAYYQKKSLLKLDVGTRIATSQRVYDIAMLFDFVGFVKREETGLLLKKFEEQIESIIQLSCNDKYFKDLETYEISYLISFGKKKNPTTEKIVNGGKKDE